MILALESQPPWVIALVVFGLSYAIVFLIVVASVKLSSRPIAADLKATTPVMLTPLAVVAGLLIAFLANRVWTGLDRASGYVAQEASSLRAIIMLSNGLPADARTTVRSAVGEYIRFVQAVEWPRMAANEATLKTSAKGLIDVMDLAIAFSPTSANQALVRERMLAALETALDARRNRILLSQGNISSIQWLVIIALDVLMLVVIAMVHIDRPRTTAINTFILSSAMACCLVLLMVHDRPFAAGGFTLAPTAIAEINIPD